MTVPPETIENRRRIRIATITLSDTRTPATDEGGRVLGELLRVAGFNVVSHAILREEPPNVRETIMFICGLDVADVVICTGGTGIAPRDRTIEAITPLFRKTLEGFGEAFRRLSFEQVGPNAMLSRAIAGVVRQRLVFALPGSVRAIRLATEQLVVPILEHGVDLAAGRPVRH